MVCNLYLNKAVIKYIQGMDILAHYAAAGSNTHRSWKQGVKFKVNNTNNMGRSSNDSMKLSNKKNRESLIIPLFTLTSPPLCVPLWSRRPWQLQGTYSPWIAKYLSFYKMKSSTLANVILSTRNTSLSVTERVRVRTERSISPNPGTCKKASNKGIC